MTGVQTCALPICLRPDIDAALSVDEQNAYYDYTLDTDPQISKAVNAATALAGQN